MRPPEPPPPVPRARWRFEPRPVRALPEELRRRAERLREALRAGHALGFGFRLRWSTGAAAAIHLEVDRTPAVRWLERLLLPAFEGGSWRPAPPVPGPEPQEVVAVAVRRSTLGVPSTGTEPSPWSDVLVGALPLLPTGWAIVLDVVPSPTAPPERPPRSPALETRPVPREMRLAPLTDTERALRERIETAEVEYRWTARLAAVRARRQDPLPAAMGRLLEAATSRGGATAFVLRKRTWWRPAGSAWLTMGEGELAGAFPGHATRVRVLHDRPAAAHFGLRLGRSRGGDEVAISVAPAEGRHLAILGETGMGKSSLLLRLAVQAARTANVVLMDPIGDTGARFLASLPRVDRERVILVAPRESPVALNALGGLAPTADAIDRDRSLGDLVDGLRRVRALRYGETPFWGPRIEETVRRALRAAAALPHGTLVEAERLLEEVGARPRRVSPDAQPLVDDLRRRVLERPEEVEGARRLLHEVTGRPTLRAMLCAPDARFSLGTVRGDRRITVFQGDAASVGESAARYLLSVQLALVASELLRAGNDRKTFLLLDEAQWYAHDAVAEMLRLGRRANLHVVLATQALASLPEPVREAVLTNAADFAVFRGSPDEARDFARWVPGLATETILGLTRGEAAVFLGKGSELAWLRVPVPRSPGDVGAALEAARESSRRYWPEPEPEPVAEPGPGEPAAASGARVREVLLVVWAALLDAAPAGEVEIPLPALRAVLDPAGPAVREAGARLGRAGALAADPRPRSQPTWVVRREPAAGLVGPTVAPEELAIAEGRWAEVRRRSADSRPTQPS